MLYHFSKSIKSFKSFFNYMYWILKLYTNIHCEKFNVPLSFNNDISWKFLKIMTFFMCFTLLIKSKFTIDNLIRGMDRGGSLRKLCICDTSKTNGSRTLVTCSHEEHFIMKLKRRPSSIVPIITSICRGCHILRPSFQQNCRIMCVIKPISHLPHLNNKYDHEESHQNSLM